MGASKKGDGLSGETANMKREGFWAKRACSGGLGQAKIGWGRNKLSKRYISGNSTRTHNTSAPERGYHRRVSVVGNAKARRTVAKIKRVMGGKKYWHRLWLGGGRRER